MISFIEEHDPLRRALKELLKVFLLQLECLLGRFAVGNILGDTDHPIDDSLEGKDGT